MDFRKILAFGTGVGIEVREKALEITIVRVRPSGIDLMGSTSISGFRERPAAEWGIEYSQFLKSHGETHLSATVLLPRREIIVRQIALPGVANRDLAAAIAFQIDTLHPYGEEDVAYGWSHLGSGGVLIGLLRRSTLERYLELFSEAGIAAASFTFSAAAIHGAIRLLAPPPSTAFLAISETECGAIEVYGESPARPVFSADFDLPVERAVALAGAELRLGSDIQASRLETILPAPRQSGPGSPLAYAAALTGACPWLAPAANLLPAERRSSNNRAMYVPTAALTILLLCVSGALLGYSAIEDRRYLSKLEAEIARLEPQSKRAVALDREIERTRARSRLLDEFRGRSKSDLDALNELTRLVAPPAWVNLIELTRDAAVINGEAEQAAALLKVIDGSPYFQNSEFAIPIARAGNNELFRIRAVREAGR